MSESYCAARLVTRFFFFFRLSFLLFFTPHTYCYATFPATFAAVLMNRIRVYPPLNRRRPCFNDSRCHVYSTLRSPPAQKAVGNSSQFDISSSFRFGGLRGVRVFPADYRRELIRKAQGGLEGSGLSPCGSRNGVTDKQPHDTLNNRMKRFGGDFLGS